MKKHLFFLAAILALSSCAPSYKHIKIFQNETASITSSIDWLSLEDTTSVIDSYEDTYTITSLDSLSQCIKVNEKDCYDIQYDSNAFHLRIKDDLPIHPYFYNSIPGILTLEFPRKIVDISGQGEIELQRGEKKIRIYKSKKNYKSQEDKLDFTIAFGEDSASSKVKHPFSVKRSGATMELLPGFGFSHVNGDAGNYIKGVSFMNWSPTIILNNVRIAPRLAIMRGESIERISDFLDSTSFSNTNFELGFGYETINSTFFNFTPIVYGGRNRLSYFLDDEMEESKFINGGFKYCLGASLDLKLDALFRKKEKREAYKDTYFNFKIDGGWYPNYFRKSLLVDGSVSYITFAFSWYMVGDNNFRKVKWKNR